MYNDLLKKVFAWMGVGLLVTFLTGYIVASNPNMISALSKWYIIFIIVELVLVIALSAGIRKMSPTTARIVFLLYSFVTGITFASIFAQFKISSIIFVFLITTIMFVILAVIGSVTKIDLTKLGTYLFVALIGVVICSIINIFVGNGMFEIVICSITLIIFLMFTAYDVQKIKQLSNNIQEENLAIYGALQLYLDFINIFLTLLRLFGGSSKD